MAGRVGVVLNQLAAAAVSIPVDRRRYRRSAGTDTLPIGVVFARQNVIAYLAVLSSRTEATRAEYVRAFKALVRHLQAEGHISSSTTAAFIRYADAAHTATAAAIALLDPQQAGAGEVFSVQAAAAHYEALDKRPQYVQLRNSQPGVYTIDIPFCATADDTTARTGEYRMGHGRVVVEAMFGWCDGTRVEAPWVEAVNAGFTACAACAHDHVTLTPLLLFGRSEHMSQLV
jgi:hypothetical protein